MPITQSRLHRTLQAAQQYQKQYQVLRERINQVCVRYAGQHITAEAAMSAIAADLMVASPYTPADTVIAEETTRYQYTYARNETEKRRMRRRRLEAGITPRDTTPQPPIPASMPPAEVQTILDDMDDEDKAIDDWASASPEEIAEFEKITGKKWSTE